MDAARPRAQRRPAVRRPGRRVVAAQAVPSPCCTGSPGPAPPWCRRRPGPGARAGRPGLRRRSAGPPRRALGYRHVGVDLVAGRSTRPPRTASPRSGPTCTRCRSPTAAPTSVSAGEILEHVADPSTVVAEACRVLRPGGMLVLDTLNATALGRFIAVTLGERMPGGAPRASTIPRLFVRPDVLVDACAAHGVAADGAGLRPAVGPLLRWLVRARRRGADRADPVDGGPLPGLGGQGGVTSVTANRSGSRAASWPQERRRHDASAEVVAGCAAVRARAAEHDRTARSRSRLRRPAGGRTVRPVRAAPAGWARARLRRLRRRRLRAGPRATAPPRWSSTCTPR